MSARCILILKGQRLLFVYILKMKSDILARLLVQMLMEMFQLN